MNDNERAEWIIATLAARDFYVPEFHAMQTEIAAKWKSDRAELAAAKALLRELRQWDVFDTSADGVYWRNRIDAAIAGSNK